MKKQITKEIVPLTPYDCYTVFRRVKSDFDFRFIFMKNMSLILFTTRPARKG